jgi:hypothetical protein
MVPKVIADKNWHRMHMELHYRDRAEGVYEGNVSLSIFLLSRNRQEPVSRRTGQKNKGSVLSQHL